MQFADIKNDIAFRKIFGNEQKTAFLEANKYEWTEEELNAHDNVTFMVGESPLSAATVPMFTKRR
jgi:hypothetical protein